MIFSDDSIYNGMNPMNTSIIEAEITKNFKNDQQARRLFHGRGGCFDGFKDLAIDFIPPYVLIECYEDDDESRPIKIKNILLEHFETSIEGIFWRNRKKSLVYQALRGKLPEKHLLWENNLCYEVTFKDNQNHGFFMDMRPGRELLQSICAGKKVLNLFAYTCSFSVVAIKHGAAGVINMDMKKNFLNQGIKNHLINHLSVQNVLNMPHDIMKSLGAIRKKGPFDIVIIDPPSSQKQHFQIEKDYRKIFKRLPEWLKEGGEVIACLNSPFWDQDFLINIKNECYPLLQLKKILGAAEEFKEKDPRLGLKIIWFSL